MFLYNMKQIVFILSLLLLSFNEATSTNSAVIWSGSRAGMFLDIFYSPPQVGEVIDSFNGINVYYNGDQGNVFGRNLAAGNYNLGLKYQCVEFVKRYYYINYGHKMPYTYGHAKELFDETLPDLKLNHKRDLYQFINGSEFRPLPGDILVFGPNYKNPYGHAGIVTVSKGKKLEIIHQNVGESTRELFIVSEINGRFFVVDPDIKGWLRK